MSHLVCLAEIDIEQFETFPTLRTFKEVRTFPKL